MRSQAWFGWSGPLVRRPWSLAFSMFAATLGTVVAGGVLSFALALHQAQGRVHAECESSMDLARRLLMVAEETAWSGSESDRVLATVLALREIRHLKVDLHAGSTVSMESATARRGLPGGVQQHGHGIPRWFLAWMEAAIRDIEPLVIDTLPATGTIVVSAQAGDESEEVWNDLRASFGHHVVLLILVSLLLIFVIRRGLRPLQSLQSAFGSLAAGDFSASVTEHVPAELHDIHAGFNRTARLLETSMRDRQMLSRRLVGLQEEERSAIARELHDELAPYLFCVRLDASAHLAVHDDTPMDEIREVFSSIDGNVAQIQMRIRELLQRLRPVDIDVHGWPEALEALLENFRTRFSDIEFRLEQEGLDALKEDTVCVSLYRVVQECLTNAVRHAHASHVCVTARCRSSDSIGAEVEVVVEDDGEGPPSRVRWGRGLTGMRERMQALGGVLAVAQAVPRGTRVIGRFPLDA
jgi:two-component system, NarL family, sensor histidine kinase UhpB